MKGELTESSAPLCGQKLDWDMPEAIDFSAHALVQEIEAAPAHGEAKFRVFLPDDPFVMGLFGATVAALMRESCGGSA